MGFDRSIDMTGADRVVMRCYAELNAFLAPSRRGRSFMAGVSGRPSVKDLIEAQGIPHTEIALILIDGEVAGCDHPVLSGQRIAIYPRFSTLDVSALSPLASLPPTPPRFVLDGHLGRLARYLRMLGFDCLYERDEDDEVLANLSAREERILLSRDIGLLKRGCVRYGHFVHAREPRRQLEEVVRYYDLVVWFHPFSRCIACNGRIEPVAKPTVFGLLPPRVARERECFRRCHCCGRVYWSGSHVHRMQCLVAALRRQMAPSQGGESSSSSTYSSELGGV